MVTSDLVFVPAAGIDLDDAVDRVDRDRLEEAMGRAGWRVPGLALRRGVDGDRQLPATQNLPKPGVLQNLRDRW